MSYYCKESCQFVFCHCKESCQLVFCYRKGSWQFSIFSSFYFTHYGISVNSLYVIILYISNIRNELWVPSCSNNHSLSARTLQQEIEYITGWLLCKFYYSRQNSKWEIKRGYNLKRSSKHIFTNNNNNYHNYIIVRSVLLMKLTITNTFYLFDTAFQTRNI